MSTLLASSTETFGTRLGWSWRLRPSALHISFWHAVDESQWSQIEARVHESRKADDECSRVQWMYDDLCAMKVSAWLQKVATCFSSPRVGAAMDHESLMACLNGDEAG